MPSGLRPSLYMKDDDYIESFTHGNFITLTNTSTADIEKIIRFELMPLNISLHSFNRKVRDLLFGNKRNHSGVDNLFKLDVSGIATNIQIVLCPGINDGIDLENTLNILLNQFRNVLSIGLVPVGITRFNKEKRLKAYNRNSSKELIEFIKKYKSANKKNECSSNIFLSDEFYLLAEESFPDYEEYGNFEQLRNGIGKVVDFEHEIKQYISTNFHKSCIKTTKNILIITSEYGRMVLNEIIKLIIISFNRYNDACKPNIEVLTIKNDFFGGNIKVTGLLTGRDIIQELRSIDLKKFDKILIPSIIFNNDGLTLDGFSFKDFNCISDKISFVEDSGSNLVDKIFTEIE